MMNNQENNIPFDLISKYLASEANDDEVKKLNEWRTLQPQNEHEFIKLEKIYSSAGVNYPIVDVDKAWNKVEQQLTKPTKNISPWISIAIAASILALVFINVFKDNDPHFFVAEKDGQEYMLPDSSFVILKKNSSLTFNRDFSKTDRSIKLTGEGFFKVKRDTSIPFVITTSKSQIKVLGTSFNVKETPLDVSVVVNTGRVEFSSLQSLKEKTVLTKGQSATISKKTNKLNMDNHISPIAHFWATKTLVFNRTKLKEVIKVVNSVYQSEIELESTRIEDCRLTVTFKEKSPGQIVEVIAATLDLEIKLNENGNQILSGESCN